MSLLNLLYSLICGHPTPPLPRVFEALVLQDYEEGTNDCSNKAGRYARALLAAGIEAHVVYVHPKTDNAMGLHAVVRTGDLICDPSTGKVSRNLADFGTYVGIVSAARLRADEELA